MSEKIKAGVKIATTRTRVLLAARELERILEEDVTTPCDINTTVQVRSHKNEVLGLDIEYNYKSDIFDTHGGQRTFIPVDDILIDKHIDIFRHAHKPTVYELTSHIKQFVLGEPHKYKQAFLTFEKEIKRLGLSLDPTGYMQGLINNLREGYNIPKEEV